MLDLYLFDHPLERVFNVDVILLALCQQCLPFSLLKPLVPLLLAELFISGQLRDVVLKISLYIFPLVVESFVQEVHAYVPLDLL